MGKANSGQGSGTQGMAQWARQQVSGYSTMGKVFGMGN